MPSSTFVSGSTGTFLSQPDNEALVVRSDDSADTTQNITIYGGLSGASQSSTFQLEGQIEVQTTELYDELFRITLDAAATGTVSVHRAGVAAEGVIYGCSQPLNGDTIELGVTGRTITYTFVDSGAGGTNILIGVDVEATLTNLADAINGIGTPANSIFFAEIPNGASLTIVDRVAVRRLFDYVMVATQAGSELILVQPTGGQTGFLVAELAPGITDVSGQVILSTPDLTENTLPAELDFLSDWIGVDGARWTVELRSTADESSFSNCSVELANDEIAGALITHPVALTTGALDRLENSGTLGGNDENMIFIRLRIKNDAVSSVPLHAQVVWQI